MRSGALLVWAILSFVMHLCIAEEECQLLKLTDITTFVNDILNRTQPIMVLSHSFTCLAAGQIHQSYRSASVVVMYMINTTVSTSQLEVFCQPDNLTVVKWMYNSSSFRDVSSSKMDLSTREDCLTCLDINENACSACPNDCRGSGRCINSSICCPFYRATGEECVDSCRNAGIDTNYICFDCPAAMKDGVTVGILVSIVIIFLVCIVVLSIMTIILLGKLKKYLVIIKGNRPENKAIQEKEVVIAVTEDQFSSESNHQHNEEDHPYQPVVPATKRSVHMYNEFRKQREKKGKSMPANFPDDDDEGDGYVDCRNRSKTLPSEESSGYVELDYQRSRKGKPRSKSIEDVDKARSLAVRKVQQMKEEKDTPVVYSYPRMTSPKLHEKKKKKTKNPADGEDEDGYVKTSDETKEHKQGQKKKNKSKNPAEGEDEDGYVKTSNETKEHKQGRVAFAKGSSIDHDDYVDCAIVEEPKLVKKPAENKSFWKRPINPKKPAFMTKK